MITSMFVPAISSRFNSLRFFGFKSTCATARPTNAIAAIPIAVHFLSTIMQTSPSSPVTRAENYSLKGRPYQINVAVYLDAYGSLISAIRGRAIPAVAAQSESRQSRLWLGLFRLSRGASGAGEIGQAIAELVTFGQREPALLHLQKILFESRIGLGGSFPRARFSVRVAIFNLFAQITEHGTLCPAAECVRSQLASRCRPNVHRFHGGGNPTKANLTTIRSGRHLSPSAT